MDKKINDLLYIAYKKLTSALSNGFKVKEWKNIFYENRNQNRNKRKTCHYIMIKGSLHQQDITILNKHAPNIRTPKYIKQILSDMKGELDKNAIVVRNFNVPLSSMDTLSRQKISNKNLNLNYTLKQLKFHIIVNFLVFLMVFMFCFLYYSGWKRYLI